MQPIAVILAAGLGTRMKSETAKVLHRVAGRPLLFYPVELARSLCRRAVAVLGHQLEDVQAALDARYGAGTISIARQERLRGTGDAVRSALPALEGEPDASVILVLSGDVPLLREDTLRELLERLGAAPLALVTFRPPSPAPYGRIVRDAAGRLLRIVEARDATDDERLIGEVNAGIYAIRLGFLRTGLAELDSNNAQGELYLTDLAARAAAAGVPTVEAPWEDVLGVNDRVELAAMDTRARRRLADAWMRAGVTLQAPETIAIDADVELAPDVTLGAGVHLRGRTRVGKGSWIDAGSVLCDATVGAGVTIKPYCVLTESAIGDGAQIGPFAHCRPGTVLDGGVHLGNFVETKKAHLGAGAKANHLAYLGDVDVGAKANVGAGTITCNYDGVHKHKTVIGARAFIGSDTQLVAPVTVGDDAYVGAGTTVTKDVPPGALAVTRTPQVNIEGYVEKRRRRGDKPK